MKKIEILILISFLLILGCKKDNPIDDEPEPDPSTENFDITPNFEVLHVFDGEEMELIERTPDNGFITATFNNTNFEVIKLSSTHDVQWRMNFGGSGSDYPKAILVTNDGYIMSSTSNSSDGDVIQNHGGYDSWHFKLSQSGSLLWEQCFGGSGNDGVDGSISIVETGVGDYTMFGHSTSTDGDVSQNNGGFDAWFYKINSSGTIQFEKNYGGGNNDFGRKILKNDAGYVLLLDSESTNGEFNSIGSWVVQINESGSIMWKTFLGGLHSGTIILTTDGGIFAVNSSSTGLLLNKLDINGTILESNSIDIPFAQDRAKHAIETTDGGFIIYGKLNVSNGGEVFLVRTTPLLNKVYEQIYPGNLADIPVSIVKGNSADSYLFQFMTRSKNLPGINYSSFKATVFMELTEEY